MYVKEIEQDIQNQDTLNADHILDIIFLLLVRSLFNNVKAKDKNKFNYI
jgi:hypothetical protein